jgi:hypothetical protein
MTGAFSITDNIMKRLGKIKYVAAGKFFKKIRLTSKNQTPIRHHLFSISTLHSLTIVLLCCSSIINYPFQSTSGLLCRKSLADEYGSVNNI